MTDAQRVLIRVYGAQYKKPARRKFNDCVIDDLSRRYFVPRSCETPQCLTLPPRVGGRSGVDASGGAPMRQGNVVRRAMRRRCRMPRCARETAADADHHGLPRRFFAFHHIFFRASTPFGAPEKNGGGSANCTAHPFATTAAFFTTAAIPAVVLVYRFSCRGELVFALVLSLPRHPGCCRYRPNRPVAESRRSQNL